MTRSALIGAIGVGALLALSVAAHAQVGLILVRVDPARPLLDRRVIVVEADDVTTSSQVAGLLCGATDDGEVLVIAGGAPWPHGWLPLPDARAPGLVAAYLRTRARAPLQPSLDLAATCLVDRARSLDRLTGEWSLVAVVQGDPAAECPLPLRVFAIDSRDTPGLHRLATDGLFLVASAP